MAASTLHPRFNDLLAQSIVDHMRIPAEDLMIVDNSTKYRPGGIEDRGDYNENQNLAAIFETMGNLNRMALESPNLCTGSALGASFRESLFNSADKIRQLVGGKRVRYVELGPEPWKSHAVLSRLIAAGVDLEYVGVDINPKSEAVMRQVLVPIIGADRFHYCIMDFHDCSHEKLAGFSRDAAKPAVTVVTNLGFQEGNDLPSRLGPMLERLTSPGDLVLSEMQVLTNDTNEDLENTRIGAFYQHPEMRQFSALVGQRFDSAHGRDSDPHKFNLLPISTEVGEVSVAVTLLPKHIQGTEKYLLTNSCLKYTLEQFNTARELFGRFNVKSNYVTGDESVVFQISERY